MAFDMYLGKRSEKIDCHEEYIFALIIEDRAVYPELFRIYEGFYRKIVISPDRSNHLVHELIMLVEKSNLSENQMFVKLVLRLLQFFSAAYVSDREIQCIGD